MRRTYLGGLIALVLAAPAVLEAQPSPIELRRPWAVHQREGGTWRRRHPLERPQGYVVTRDHDLWSRSQMIVSVHRGEQPLFVEPAGDTLALRIIPMRTGDPRLPVRP